MMGFDSKSPPSLTFYKLFDHPYASNVAILQYGIKFNLV